ncbi:MAG: glycosyltransferase family 39 protein [Erysipelotrichaceae bacterium]|nr:glycosyltransferase family 39 protein [Erysipelotrichaceae bacterium]
MNLLENKKIRYILFTLLIFLGFGLAIISCRYHADKFLIDDMLSFSLSNTPGGWVSYDNFGWVDTTQFSRFAVLENKFDFTNVWANQAADCHPPLFYLIIHIISSFFSPNLSYWYGYIPNIIYYLLTSIMIYKLSYKITKSYDSSFLIMFLYIINPVVLYYVAFIRMYTLVNLFAIIFAYIAIDFFDIEKITKKTYISLSIVTTLGCLTHYYSYVIYFFICLVIGLFLLFKKHYKQLIYFCVSVLSGIIIALLIFPAAINHWLNNQHSVNAITNLQESGNTLNRYISYLNTNPLNYLILIIVLLIIVFSVINKHKNLSISQYTLIFTFFAYFLLVGKTSSFVTHRYMVPIDSIMFVGLLTSLFTVVKPYKNNYINKIILSIFIISVTGLPTIYIKDYKNPISYAKAHYGDLLIVYNDSNWDANYTNVNAFEFREYENMYIMNDSYEARLEKADFFLYEDAIVYVAYDMDLELVKMWLFGSSRFTNLEPTDINTAIYAVYYAY